MFNDIEIPLLGDFAYGEFEFQTTDGQDFLIAAFIDNKSVDDVRRILSGQSFDLYSIMTQLADKKDNKPFSPTYPLCPYCKRTIRHYTDNKRAAERQVDYVTWNDFQSKDEDEKGKTVLALAKL